MHTILGANGAIGRALSPHLAKVTDRVRQASRSPRAVNAGDELLATDLLDPAAVDRAVTGSEVAYLLAGLKYDARVWAEQWPRIMGNVIESCIRHDCRLVFFDNVYAYGMVRGPMREDTPFNPASRKGEVRARIASMLLDTMRSGALTAMIVRAADFYGPDVPSSFPHATVFTRLQAQKKPQWIGDPGAVHSFTFTPDAGRAVALLAQHDAAWGRTWHAPTDPERITGARFVRIACEAAGQPYRLQRAPRWLLRAMGLFTPVLRENMEMMYQFEHDYYFDSTRVHQELGLSATPYPTGIAAAQNASPTVM